VALTMWH